MFSQWLLLSNQKNYCIGSLLVLWELKIARYGLALITSVNLSWNFLASVWISFSSTVSWVCGSVLVYASPVPLSFLQLYILLASQTGVFSIVELCPACLLVLYNLPSVLDTDCKADRGILQKRFWWLMIKYLKNKTQLMEKN